MADYGLVGVTDGLCARVLEGDLAGSIITNGSRMGWFRLWDIDPTSGEYFNSDPTGSLPDPTGHFPYGLTVEPPM